MSGWAYTFWGLWLLVVVSGALFRSRLYAIFRGVTLGLHSLVALALIPHMGIFKPTYLALNALIFFDALMLIRPRPRSTAYRLFVSLPAHYLGASTLLAFPWAIASAFGFEPWGLPIPFVLGAFGLFQSLTTKRESPVISVGNVEIFEGLMRIDRRTVHAPGTQTPLRIAQITDPHLGPFMTVQRLNKICERIAAQEPDLVLLTGDFLTMESQRDPGALKAALAPLRRLSGRVFACMGNHDHESPEVVKTALSDNSIELLIDDVRIVDTTVGPVQLLGLDFHFRDRNVLIPQICARYPRVDGVPRLILLHDPGAFVHVPVGEADLVLSGHTHGGQVGLVSLGHSWTFAGFVAKIPDHGLWGLGKNRLYVHRGTGHYGFPLRLGVPAEESVVSVHVLA